MAVHWGVDTIWTATEPTVPGGTESVWDWICAIYGKSPEFWGRYLNRGKQPLNSAEAGFLRGHECRIVPIVYPNAERMHVPGRPGYAHGQRSGNTTLDLADKIGVPDDVFIYIDIEDTMQPSLDWMDGWTSIMLGSRFGGMGGFYCGPKFITFRNPYCKLLDKYKSISKQSDRSIWSFTPRLGDCTKIPGSISGNEPDCDAGATAVWQYAVACHGFGAHEHTNIDYDLDVANDDGFAVMWGGQPPSGRQKMRAVFLPTPIGRWEVHIDVWTWNYIFRPDNTVVWTDIVTPSVIREGTGTWAFEGNYLRIKWWNGNVEDWHIPLNPNSQRGHQNGLPIVDAKLLSREPQ
jgi:hypothetical protein